MMSSLPADFDFRRVLVTGGCGFIGSALVRHLVGGLGIEVLNLDKLTYAGDPSTVEVVANDPRYHWLQADVCDGAAVAHALLEFRPDAVIHLAAESHVDRSIDRPADFVKTNVLGTSTLLDAALSYWNSLDENAHKRFRLLHLSTDEVYGSLPLDGDARFDINSPYAPNSPYAASKAAADHLARAWFRTYGLPVLVSTCSNNYGPYQFPEKLIPTMVIAGIEGRPMPVYGQGLNVRDWLHVDDHIEALTAILMRGIPGETYLVGGGAEWRNVDLVRALCAILDELLPGSPHRPHANLIRFQADRPGHDLRYGVDDSATRAATGWAPRQSFEPGLRSTIEWYLANRGWWERIRQDRHTGERLGIAPRRVSA